MKILWLCNIMLPAIAKQLHMEYSVKEGWLTGTLSRLTEAGAASPIELGIMFDYSFGKYCSNLDIKINNLYLNDIYNNRKHFILISYNDKFYCYNYNKESFVSINKKDLVDNLESEKIGVYLNEDMPISYKYKEVV